jgi:hypothetical protein
MRKVNVPPWAAHPERAPVDMPNSGKRIAETAAGFTLEERQHVHIQHAVHHPEHLGSARAARAFEVERRSIGPSANEVVESVLTEAAGAAASGRGFRPGIAVEAFSCSKARGFEHGHDVEDWLAAEALVRAAADEPPAALRVADRFFVAKPVRAVGPDGENRRSTSSFRSNRTGGCPGLKGWRRL